MSDKQIRPIVLGIIWRGDELLVFEAYDWVKDETYYRPLGGGIEFGERSQDALLREFREELGVELVGVRYLTALENIYTRNGQIGHEIVLLYEASLGDPAFYEREIFEVHEEIETLPAYWMPLHKFQVESIPLYPDGLLELLTDNDTT
jgi:8-oxo-dGTP pyrophosphatase MutT (NUDIX family)